MALTCSTGCRGIVEHKQPAGSHRVGSSERRGVPTPSSGRGKQADPVFDICYAHEVSQEASRFTRHARRTTMTTADIDQALRVLNIEPLYGHSPYNPPTFRRALPYPSAPTTGTVYFVEDEEVDFDRVLREDKIPLPKPASWTAHWLAVEGVQPLIPENPSAIPREHEGDGIAKHTSPPRTNTQFPPYSAFADPPRRVLLPRKEPESAAGKASAVEGASAILHSSHEYTATSG